MNYVDICQAHTISEWGKFRPDLTMIGDARRFIPNCKIVSITIFSLSSYLCLFLGGTDSNSNKTSSRCYRVLFEIVKSSDI